MNISLTYKHLALCLTLAGGMLLHGCSTIDEDISGCITLTLEYDYYLEGVDLEDTEFIELVDYIQLYIFDRDLRFLELIEVPTSTVLGGHLITVPISYIGNTMVAWAREMRGSYHIPTLKVGDHIDLLTLTLKTQNNTSSKELANIFHGGRELMTFSGANNTHKMKFMHKDKQLNISLTDNTGAKTAVSLYDIKLTASNGCYYSDNSIVPNSPMITYTPTNVAKSRADVSVANIHTLRLKKKYSDDVKLTIINKATGKPITFLGADHLKLVDYLLNNKPADMDDQEYLDRVSDWDISFNTTIKDGLHIAVSITINDWTVWFNNTDL